MSKYMGQVKVGPKGQIVIPKEVREMFKINPGDTLMLLADDKKGIAIERFGFFEKIANGIFARYGNASADEKTFAKNIKEMTDIDGNKDCFID